MTQRRYELTDMQPLDEVPYGGDLVVELAPGLAPGLLPINVLQAEFHARLGDKFLELERRIEEAAQGTRPITPPVITTNNGADMTVTVTEGSQSVITLAATGTGPIVWDRSGPNGTYFVVDSGTWEVLFRLPALIGTYKATFTSRNGSPTTDSINLTVNVKELLNPDTPRVVFSDDFNDTDLSRFSPTGDAQLGKITYQTQYPWGADQPINNEPQKFVFPQYTGKGATPLGIQPLSLTTGFLRISQVRQPSTITNQIDFPSSANASTGYWTSGVVHTRKTFAFQYGEVAARLRFSATKGTWPCFWFLAEDDTILPEIDLIEGSGSRPNSIHFNVHQANRLTGARMVTASGWVTLPGGKSVTDWIEYKLVWTKERIEFYADGTLMHSVVGHDIHCRMYVIACLASGNGDEGWIPFPDASTASPNTFDVERIMVSQVPSSQDVLPTITAKPSLSIVGGWPLDPGDTITVTPGTSSDGTLVSRYLMIGAKKIPGTDLVTSYVVPEDLIPPKTGDKIQVYEEWSRGSEKTQVFSNWLWLARGELPFQPPAEPPVSGLSMTFDYYPVRDGIDLLTGGTLPLYEANKLTNPSRVWMPRSMDGSANDTNKGTINPEAMSFQVDPGYNWSNRWTPFSITGSGDLAITARQTTGLGFATGEIPNDPKTGVPYQWVSGMLSTQASFKQYGGYFEFEVRGPEKDGNWWSGWLLNEKVYETRGEVDVVEMPGSGLAPNGYQTNVITSDHPQNTHENRPVTTSIATTFHRYGVYIGDAEIRFYRDGVLTDTVDISSKPKLVANPYWIILTNFLGSHVAGWVGAPTGATPNPSNFEIRRVTAWQRPGPVALSLNSETFGDDAAVGSTVATLSHQAFGSSTGVTYSKVTDPSGKFNLVGNELRLAFAGSGIFTTTLRATDSLSRTFTRQFTLSSMPWVPAGASNISPAILSSEKEGVTTSGNVLTETATSSFHGINFTGLTRAAGSATLVVLCEVESATVPMFSFESFDSTWARSCGAIFDLKSSKVLSKAAGGGWAMPVANIMPIAANKWRVRLQCNTDDASTGLNVLVRHASANGDRWYAGSTANNSTVTNIGIYLLTDNNALTVGQEMQVSGAPGSSITGLAGSSWGDNVRNQYSCLSAWNADQSLLMLMNSGTPNVVFLNGTTFQPVALPVSTSGLNEVRWHPTDPNSLICVGGNAVTIRNVRTGASSSIATFSGSGDLTFGGYTGNPSDDGQWIIVSRGFNPVNTCWLLNLNSGVQTLLAQTGDFTSLDYATISPLGTYMFFNGQTGAGYDRTRIYSRSTGSLVQDWSESGRPSHGDLTVYGGQEYAVGPSQVGGGFEGSTEDGRVISRRLSDGAVTRLTDYGYGQHASCRNYLARGTAVVWFANLDAPWATNANKAMLINMSGSGSTVAVPNLGFQRGDNDSGESNPTISPDGRFIVWRKRTGGLSGPIGTWVRRIA